MSREGEESADSAHVTLPPPRAPAVETGRGEAARRGDGCTRGGEFRWAAGAGQGRGLAAGGGAGRGLVGESAVPTRGRRAPWGARAGRPP